MAGRIAVESQSLAPELRVLLAHQHVDTGALALSANGQPAAADREFAGAMRELQLCRPRQQH